MRHNWKFHAIAISVISGVVFILYALIGPSNKQVVVQQAASRYITIYSATWGMNCNPYIVRANETLQQLRLHPEALEKMAPEERPLSLDPIAPVKTDNVLATVSERCNNQVTCSFDATSENLKSDPLTSCYKQLDVSFRCFSFDHLHTFKINQSETLTIDCNEPAAETAQ